MHNFLFITHLTPKALLSPLRKQLIALSEESLKNQSYLQWKQLLLGEDDKVKDNFHYVSLAKNRDVDSIIEAFSKPEVKALIEWADYLIKFDEDDLFSAFFLEHIKSTTDDFIGSKTVACFEITSGLGIHMVYDFFVGTGIHKKSHALASYTGEGCSKVGNVFYSDHSKSWHLYYKNRKVKKTTPEFAMYVWVISPTSLTISKNFTPIQHINEIDFSKYDKYLRSFGKWEMNFQLFGFDSYLEKLSKIWCETSGKKRRKLIFNNKFLFGLRQIKYAFQNRLP